MNKSTILILLLLALGRPAMSQLFTFGVQLGSNHSLYRLSEDNSIIQVTKGSLGFHSGFFFRRDFDNFYVGADLNYSSIIGGTLDDGYSSFDVRTGSVNLPLFFGKKFYPGIRIFVGGVPTVFIKHNDNELRSFLENSPSVLPSINGDQLFNEFILYIMAGAGFEFSKFFLEFRYEHPLDYFIKEDFSTGGTLTNIDNNHYIYQIIITLGYRFN